MYIWFPNNTGWCLTFQITKLPASAKSFTLKAMRVKRVDSPVYSVPNKPEHRLIRASRLGW